SAIYLKDEKLLDDYLIENGLEGAVLELHNGTQLASTDLKAAVELARIVTNLIKPLALSRRVTSQSVIEQAAIAGALNPEILADPDRAIATASYIARRLDALAARNERGWKGAPSADGGMD